MPLPSSSVVDPTKTFCPELWLKVCEQLRGDIRGLCALAATSRPLKKLARYSLRQFAASICVYKKNIAATSKTHFIELILIRHTSCECTRIQSSVAVTQGSLADALSGILGLVSKRLENLHFDGDFRSEIFALFADFKLPSLEYLVFSGHLPETNSLYELFNAATSLKFVTVRDINESADFSSFWPHLKNSTAVELQLLNIKNLHNSRRDALKSMRLPKLKSFVLRPGVDEMDSAADVAHLLSAAPLKMLHLASTSKKDHLLHAINANPTFSVVRPLQTLQHLVFASTNFAINPLMDFLNCCPQLCRLTWMGLSECAAAIVVARLLKQLGTRNDFKKRPRIVLDGTKVCEAGHTFRSHGIDEVTRSFTGYCKVEDLSKDLKRIRDELAGFEDEIIGDLLKSDVIDAVLFGGTNIEVQQPPLEETFQILYVRKKKHCCHTCNVTQMPRPQHAVLINMISDN